MTPTLTSHSGVKMPAIVYGTAWKEDRTADCVAKALDSGFRGIDTACQPKHYFEPGVGEGIAKSGLKREDIYLQTKFTGINGQDPNRIPYDPAAPLAERVEQSVAVSFENLKTDYLDSLVLHGPLPEWEENITVWRALEEVQKSGRARQIGLSNCYDPEMFQAFLDMAEVKPAVLQNRFYQETGYDKELRAICKEHNIFYQCFWTLTANPHILESSQVQKICSDLGKTPAQIFFRFVHQQGIQILTGTTSPEHMKQDLAIFEFELSPDQVESIQSLI